MKDDSMTPSDSTIPPQSSPPPQPVAPKDSLSVEVEERLELIRRDFILRDSHIVLDDVASRHVNSLFAIIRELQKENENLRQFNIEASRSMSEHAAKLHAQLRRKDEAWTSLNFCNAHLEDDSWTQHGCPVCAAGKENLAYVNLQNQRQSQLAALTDENKKLREDNDEYRRNLARVVSARAALADGKEGGR